MSRFNILPRERNLKAVKRVAYVKSEESNSDILTKPLSNEKFHHLLKRRLIHVREFELRILRLKEKKH